MKVRVKFSKQGNMKYIGHLDVMRYFQKAIRRAGIDIAYTEGLSPHMIMSFASPLGVGLTSDAEYMDIELRTPIASRDAIDALNRVGVEGITVTGFYEIPEGKANKAMTLVAAADYLVRFRSGYEPERILHLKISDDTTGSSGKASADLLKEGSVQIWKSLSSAVEAFYARDEILVWKKSKKSEKEVDIRPMIYEMRYLPAPGQTKVCSLQPDDGAEKSTGNYGAVFLKLASGSVANLKPELVMDTMLSAYGIEPEPFAYEINRCEIYADMGDGGSQSQTGESRGTAEPDSQGGKMRSLIPLGALGREIF